MGRLVTKSFDVAEGHEYVGYLAHVQAEHARMLTMNDSLRNFLEILEIRQAIELNRTPAVGRVAQTVMAGEFHD